MKKLFLAFFAITCVVTVQAQTPADSLKEYTGKYKFPEGSAVPEVIVTIENGVLVGASPMGSSELKRIEKDVFEVVAYSGIATFKRDDQSKINGVKIEVEGMVLEGTKSEAATGQAGRHKLGMPGR